MPFFVYLLLSSNNSTYVGATVDLERRLRQHNKEIKGGAVATTSKIDQGQVWVRVAHIAGFPNWPSALQFEWRWKQLTRKITKSQPKLHPLNRRMLALKELLALKKPTEKAIPYSEWPQLPEINLEDDEARKYYDDSCLI